MYLQLLNDDMPKSDLLECTRYLHAPHHTLVLEAQFRDELLKSRLELRDVVQESNEYIEVCNDYDLDWDSNLFRMEAQEAHFAECNRIFHSEACLNVFVVSLSLFTSVLLVSTERHSD